MARKFQRNPGSDQVAKWKAALAGQARQRRRARYSPPKPVGQPAFRPGMARMTATMFAAPGDGVDGGDGKTAKPKLNRHGVRR